MQRKESVNNDDGVAVTLWSTIKNSIMSAIVCMLPSKNLVEEDVREKRLLVSTSSKSLIHAKKDITINLEDLTHSSMVAVMITLYLSTVAAIVITAITVLLSVQTFLELEYRMQDIEDFNYPSLEQVLVYNGLEGALRTIATVISLWLLFSFPQRCIVHSITNRKSLLPEQIVLISSSIVVVITPILSVAAIVAYWWQFSSAITYSEYFLRVFSAGFSFEIAFYGLESSLEIRTEYSRVMVIIVRSWVLIAIGVLTSILGRRPLIRSYKQSTTRRMSNGAIPDAPHGDNDGHNHHPGNSMDMDNASDAQAELAGCKCNPKKPKPGGEDIDESCVDECKGQCIFCGVSAKVTLGYIFNGEVVRLFFVLTIYAVISIVLSINFNFTMSLVPLAGIVTVLKVCLSPPRCLDAEFVSNCNESEIEHGNCSPRVLGGLVYNRAVTIVCLGIFEIFIFLYLHQLSNETSNRLKKLDYQSCRSKHLGFKFFRSNKYMIQLAILIVSLLATIIPDTNFWIYRAQQEVWNGPNANVTFYFDPFHSVGIGYSTPGLGGIYLLLIVFHGTLMYVYLPPRSNSFQHWWCPNTKPRGKEATDIDHPTYLMREDGILSLRKLREDLLNSEMDNIRQPHSRWGRIIQHRRYLDRMFALTSVVTGLELSSPSEDEVKIQQLHSLPEIVEQIQSNVLVMETEVLMWNFAHSAYDLGTGKLDIPDDNIIFGLDLENENESLEEENTMDNAVSVDLRNHELMNAQAVTDHKSVALGAMVDLVDGMETVKVNANEVIVPVTQASSPLPVMSRAEKEKLVRDIVDDEEYRFIAHFENEDTDTQCGLFFKNKEGDNRIVVTFRGTVTTENMKTDMDFVFVSFPAAVRVPPMEDKDKHYQRLTRRTPLVHRGFIKAYASIRRQLVTCIDKLLEKYPDSVIMSTGHSLGGALAVVFGFDMGLSNWRASGMINALPSEIADKVKFNEKTHIIDFSGVEGEDIKLISKSGRRISGIQISTFGCPRIGNFSLVQRIRTVVHTIHRFLVQSDIIPKLNTIPSTTVADFLKEGYQHVGVELLMDLDGNMIIGPKFVERQMMHGWRGVSAANHFRGTYTLALMFWCGRAHEGEWVPDWWRMVVENLNYQEEKRLNSLKPDVRILLHDQLAKEGAKFINKFGTKCASKGFQTGSFPLDCELTAAASLDAELEILRRDSIAIADTEDDVVLILDHCEKSGRVDSDATIGDDDANDEGDSLRKDGNDDRLNIV